MEPVSYGEILAANFRAARARAGLEQELVAARMRALGYAEWRYQTVGQVERGKRRLNGEEIMALSWVLGTTLFSLMKPTGDDDRVQFPSGATISARSIALSAAAHRDHAVTWDGDKPEFSPDSGDVTARIIVTPRIPQGSGGN